jgi:DNA sulfur modification protein DndB
MAETVTIPTLVGRSADREVLLGFASARLLHSLSFADVLDEDNGTGYQRRFSPRHSLDFRRYVRKPGGTTPPLTFNLRPRDDFAWSVEPEVGATARLILSLTHGRILSQVDCQHRLGHIGDLDLMFPFMVFLGLTEREEMEVFNTINSKAKGLSGSLLDYHAAHLVRDLGKQKPELLVALHLNEDPESPWYKQLDLGGKSTSGLKRRASLRTVQKAVKRFLSASSILDAVGPDEVARLVTDFWIAVEVVLRPQWRDARRHFLTKGIGVYALMGLLGDLWKESNKIATDFNRTRFAELLDDFAPNFNWSNEGPFKGLGGEAGVQEGLVILRHARRVHSPAVSHG